MRRVWQLVHPVTGEYVLVSSERLATRLIENHIRESWKAQTDFEVVGAVERDLLRRTKREHAYYVRNYGQEWADTQVRDAQQRLESVVQRARTIRDRGYAAFKASMRRSMYTVTPQIRQVYSTLEEARNG